MFCYLCWFDAEGDSVDPQKRAAFDQHGSDPESRFGGMSSAGAGRPGFAGGPFAGPTFEGELSPEDLFNMFFGGGLGGGVQFGGPGGNAFSYLHILLLLIIFSFHCIIRTWWVQDNKGSYGWKAERSWCPAATRGNVNTDDSDATRTSPPPFFLHLYDRHPRIVLIASHA